MDNVLYLAPAGKLHFRHCRYLKLRGIDFSSWERVPLASVSPSDRRLCEWCRADVRSYRAELEQRPRQDARPAARSPEENLALAREWLALYREIAPELAPVARKVLEAGTDAASRAKARLQERRSTRQLRRTERHREELERPETPSPAYDADGDATEITDADVVIAGDGQSDAARPAEARSFDLEHPSYIAFDPKSNVDIEARSRLRTGVRRLRAEAGELLYARFDGRMPANADVENVLLYNVDSGGGCFAAAMSHGVCFERHPDIASPRPARYSYRLQPASDDFSWWIPLRPLAMLPHVDLGGSTPSISPIWWSGRTGFEIADGVDVADAPLVVHLSVSGPVDALRPGQLKVLIDGLVSALHYHSDRVTLPTVAERVAAGLGLEPSEVAAALTDRGRAPLGGRRLLQTRAYGVQWTPDDHLCVAGHIRFERNPTWTMTGTVSAVRPRC